MGLCGGYYPGACPILALNNILWPFDLLWPNVPIKIINNVINLKNNPGPSFWVVKHVCMSINKRDMTVFISPTP